MNGGDWRCDFRANGSVLFVFFLVDGDFAGLCFGFFAVVVAAFEESPLSLFHGDGGVEGASVAFAVGGLADEVEDVALLVFNSISPAVMSAPHSGHLALTAVRRL